MGILGSVRNIPWPSGKQISKKPDRNSSHFLKKNIVQEGRAVLKRGRGKKIYAVITSNITTAFFKLSFKERKKHIHLLDSGLTNHWKY